MGELRPESPTLLAYYWQHLDEHSRIADDCRIPAFSEGLRADLLVLLKDKDAVRLIEVVTRMGDFGNSADFASSRKAVSRLLKTQGVRLPRGKRTAPGLLELVARLAPLLLHFGLPLATNERSPLVNWLRRIADELGVPGDPRDELRRLNRLKKILEGRAFQVLIEAFARGFAP